MSNLLRNCRTAGATLLRAGHIGRAEHGKHAGHAGFPLPRQADSVSASGTATFPVQSTRLHCNLDTTAARFSRAAVPLMPLAYSTGLSEPRTTLHLPGILCLAGGLTRAA